jgi:hypothetical protein
MGIRRRLANCKNDPVKFPKTHPITQHSKDAIKSML